MYSNFTETDIDRIKDEIKELAGKLDVERVQDGNATAGRLSHLKLLPLHFETGFLPNFRNHFNYRDLARYDDREFIRNAYLAVLRHSPDPHGEQVYTDALRRGRSKVETIIRLRYSREGRSYKVRIKGLIIPILIDLPFRIPLIGYILKILKEIIMLPRTVNQLRTRQEIMRRHINDSNVETQEKLNRIISHINRDNQ